MNRIIREIVELAEQLGFTYEGTTGSGHVRLVHQNGAAVTLPSTPSEYRGRANSVAYLERVSGRKLPRAKHRRSHKACKPSGFSVDVAVAEQSRWRGTTGATVEALEERRERLIAHCHELARKRQTIHAIPSVLDKIAAIEAELRTLHRPVDPFDPFTLRP